MSNFLKAMAYVILALGFVVLATWLSDKVSQKTNTVPSRLSVSQVYKGVTCPQNYSSYQLLSEKPSQVVQLINGRKAMYAANGQFVNTQVVVTKNDTKESKVACGYLYVQAGTNTYGALQSWESLYINPNGFGGHINKENQFGPGDGEKYSEYLFSLNKILYWKDNNDFSKNSLQTADWGALLNVSDEVKFQIAFNTADTTGFINNVSIAYKCWNPETGEENTGCKLVLKGNPHDTYSSTNPF